jgi:hypothetical protein
MISYPACSARPVIGFTGIRDRHQSESAIAITGLGDRHPPESLIGITGMRSSLAFIAAFFLLQRSMPIIGYVLLVILLAFVAAWAWSYRQETRT